jgi:5-hydroxyisourate hydrolase
MSSLSTHVLDTARGRPAAGVPVTLAALAGGTWTDLVQAATDAEGRVRFVLPAGVTLAPGATYRLRFDTGEWSRRQGQLVFYPVVEITFILQDDRHHHVPLLLAPFGYSTYRGS